MPGRSLNLCLCLDFEPSPSQSNSNLDSTDCFVLRTPRTLARACLEPIRNFIEISNKKNPVPAICWDRIYIPAVPPGLTHFVSSQCILIYAVFFHEVSISVSHTLKISLFPVALRSPFSFVLLPCSQQPRLSENNV